MKNIFLVPTDSPRYDKYLVINKEGKLCIWDTQTMGSQNTLNPLNIYITNEERKRIGDYVYDKLSNTVIKITNETSLITAHHSGYFKVVITTDAQLIADGVQAIDDTFLEWFVNNHNCEYVEVLKDKCLDTSIMCDCVDEPCKNKGYKIISSQKEPKQECKGSFKDCFKPLEECVCDRQESPALQKMKGAVMSFLSESETNMQRVWDSELLEELVNYKPTTLMERSKTYSEDEFLEGVKEAYALGRKNVLLKEFNKWVISKTK